MSNATTGAISGAASGAAIGSMVAPGIGTAIGAGVGFLGGAILGLGADEEEAKLERERVAEMQRTSAVERAQRDQASQLATAAVTTTGAEIGQSGYDSPTGLLGDMISRNETNGSGNKTSSAGTF